MASGVPAAAVVGGLDGDAADAGLNQGTVAGLVIEGYSHRCHMSPAVEGGELGQAASLGGAVDPAADLRRALV
jgi:hypothetical protein